MGHDFVHPNTGWIFRNKLGGVLRRKGGQGEMIARFRILLPFKLSIPDGLSLGDLEVERPSHRIVVHPPLKARLSTSPEDVGLDVPFFDAGHGIVPAEPQRPSSRIHLNGKPTLQANLLQMDFHKDDFDRGGTRPPHDEPVILIGFEVANSLLRRLRTVGQAAGILALDPTKTSWSLEYLSDAGEELPREPGLVRRGYHVRSSGRLQAVTEVIWQRVKSLPSDYEPSTWDNLLLDAELLMPQVGPVVVLAQSAIETAVSAVLNHLASRTPLPLPPGLWEWIDKRDDDYRKEPSVREQCDILLEALGGKSLKQERELWEAFTKIRKARNNFVHEGVASVDGKTVTPAEAAELLGKAKQVVAFLERFLPESQRRPATSETFDWRIELALSAPMDPKSE